jgi:hypothetical protein
MYRMTGEQDQMPTLTWRGPTDAALLKSVNNRTNRKVTSGFELIPHRGTLSLPKDAAQSDDAERKELYRRAFRKERCH